jgi:hypothetical protein
MKLCDVYHVGLSDFFNDEKHVQLTSSLVANLSKVSDSDYRLIDKLVQIAAGTTE